MIRNLLSTSTFRLSLVSALFFSLIAVVALWGAYWLAAKEVRQQTDDRLQLEANVLLSRYYTGSFEDLSRMVTHRMHEDSSRFLVYKLVHLNQPASLKKSTGEMVLDKPYFSTMPLGDLDPSLPASSAHLIARVLTTNLPNYKQLLVGADMAEQELLLEHIGEVVLFAILLILIISMAGGAWLGYSNLKRIEVIREKAEDIIHGDLTQRMPIHGRQGSEYDKLGKVINHMLGRLEVLMNSIKNVNNNLAHDLRNPLNRLYHRLEALRDKPENSPEQKRQLGIAIEDVDRLISTFNAILNISQVEAGAEKNHWEVVDISKILNDIGEIYSPVLEEEGGVFTVNVEPDLKFKVDRHLLAQAVTNLLDNAIKYTSSKEVVISLEGVQQEDGLIIRISDSGPGIPAEDKERVFQHLVRLDNARSQPGNGLGLSLVKAIMDLHEGEIIMKDNNPGLMVELFFSNRTDF